MKKVKVNVGGQSVEGEITDFKPMQEPWSVYQLDDGTTFKLKLVVSDVIKLPTKDPVTGLPQLIVRSSNIISIEPPDLPISKKDVQ